MPDAAAIAPPLTSALEDYLETIFELVRDQQVARIRDIAKARAVKPASVSPAMKRLADLGLIEYERREYIRLTPSGETTARRIYARHQLLTRFFRDVLGIAAGNAEADACAMEHSLSDGTMDAVTRFIEFIGACPEGAELLSRFHRCALVHRVKADGSACRACTTQGGRGSVAKRTVADLQPGEEAKVAQVLGRGAIRQRLLDMGLLPGAKVQLERRAPLGEPLWIRLQGFQLSLRGEEARSIVVEAAS